MKKLSDAISDHPLIIILGFTITVVITVATITFNITTNQYKERLVLQQYEYENRIKQFDHVLSNDDNNSFDLKKIVIPHESTKNIPTSSTFFKNDRFFSQKLINGFTYSYESTAKYYKRTFNGVPVFIDQIPYGIMNEMEKLFIHLWSSENFFYYKTSIGTFNFFSHITNERITLNQMAKILNKANESSLNKKDLDIKVITPLMWKEYVPRLLLAELNFISPFTSYNQKNTFRVDKIASTNDFLHMSSFIKLIHDNQNDKDLYLSREFIVIPVSNAVYVIRIHNASDKAVPNAKITLMNEWLLNLRILQ